MNVQTGLRVGMMLCLSFGYVGIIFSMVTMVKAYQNFKVYETGEGFQLVNVVSVLLLMVAGLNIAAGLGLRYLSEKK